MGSSSLLLKRYDNIISTGLIRRDAGQIKVLQKLDDLCQRLVSGPECSKATAKQTWTFKRPWDFTHKESKKEQGLYVYGGVGCGKTMLMDLFYTFCPFPSKHRIHYNAFMLSVHKRLHELKQQKITFPMTTFCQEYSKKNKLLCLDELQVVDVADAMLLRGLLEGLFANNVHLVITSNRPPKDLYLNGIQRQSFLPCIGLIEERLNIVGLESEIDYRQSIDKQDDDGLDKRNTSEADIFMWPITKNTDEKLESMFNSLCEKTAKCTLLF